jgi:5-methylcytosine-specific restriction endonuclease McrA
MSRQNLSRDVLAFLKSIKGKRARIVVDHILEHGLTTTEQLKRQYGYDHAPRAVRDVIDQGVPLSKQMIMGADRRRMAEYRFGDLSKIRPGRIGGRRAFTKAFKIKLVERHGSECSVCNLKLDARYLQVDHRVPYEVIGDRREKELSTDDCMLLCGSCNRAKSWSCEHCKNWIADKRPALCACCYWGNPTAYTHIALTDVRRLDLTWSGAGVGEYDQAAQLAEGQGMKMPEFVKQSIRRWLTRG